MLGGRCSSFCAQTCWVSLQGCHRALPDLRGPSHPCHVVGKRASAPACGLAKTPGCSAEGMPQMLGLSGAAHRGLKQRGASAPSPTMWDKQVLAFLEEKGHPKSGQLLDLVTYIYVWAESDGLKCFLRLYIAVRLPSRWMQSPLE